MKKQKLKLTLAALIAISSSMSMAQSSTTTSTTSASAAVPAKKFGVKYQNLTGTDFDTATTKGGGASDNFLSLTYKAQENLKLGVRVGTNLKIAGKGDKREKATMYDTMLSASVTHGGILGTEKTPVVYSILLPTSNDSKNANQVLAYRTDIILDYNIRDKVTSEFIIRPVLGMRIGDDQFTNKFYGELCYANTKVISTYGYFEHNLAANVGQNKTAKTSETLELGVGLDVAPNDNITVGVSVGQARHLFNSAANNANVGYKFADSKESNYAFQATLIY